MTHTEHPNFMPAWESIACQRGHETHETRRVHVDLAQPHGYHDYAQIPERLARAFDMMIYPPETYPVDGGPYCVDAETEALTRDGWKFWSELVPGVDALYGYDTETGLGRWTELLGLNVLPDEERSMLVMSGRHHSSVTTADHRWWVERRRQAKRYKANALVSIKEAAPRAMYATSAELTARDRVPCSAPAGEFPSEPKYSDAFVELVAWFWTEGHIRRSSGRLTAGEPRGVDIYQSHSVNGANVARIVSCLQRLYGAPSAGLPQYRVHPPPAAWTERRHASRPGMSVFSLNYHAAVPLLDVAPDKIVTPEFIASLTLAQLLLFVEASLLGDGSSDRRIAQRSRDRLNAMQMAWALLGRRTLLRYKADDDMWYLTAQDRRYFQVADVNPRWENRRGVVWCPTTETGTWLARHNGHAFFTGNCPAHDAVSETIVSHGIWEPRETALVLAVCESAEPGQIVCDFGAQLGWFSLLAASCGVEAIAYDADSENLRVLRESASANGWEKLITTWHLRIDEQNAPFAPGPIRLAKIDVEGAEDQVVRVLWPSIEAGLVDFMLIEVSPVFADYYPDMVASIIDAGYRAYLLPPKQQPPVTLDNPEWDLAPYRFDTLNPDTVLALVGAWHQENVLFAREGASW